MYFLEKLGKWKERNFNNFLFDLKINKFIFFFKYF